MRSLALIALLLLSQFAHAEEQSGAGNSQDTVEGSVDQRTESSASDAPPQPAADKEGSLQRRVVPTQRTGARNFTPSEKISADNSVPFPVDI